MKLSPLSESKYRIYRNFFNYFSQVCEAKTHLGCTYTSPEADFPLFNSIIDTQVSMHDMQQSIDEMKQVYNYKKQFCWWHTDFVQPQILPQRLLENGFKVGGEFIGMIYDLSKPIALAKEITNIPVETVTQEAQLDEWVKPMQIAFGIDDNSSAFCVRALKRLFHDPRFKHFYVKRLGEIVATGSLFVEEGVSGFYNLAVLPEWRHQKLATALKWHRLKLSQALGAKVAILQSSDMGKVLDERIGFKPVMRFIPYFS